MLNRDFKEFVASLNSRNVELPLSGVTDFRANKLAAGRLNDPAAGRLNDLADVEALDYGQGEN